MTLIEEDIENTLSNLEDETNAFYKIKYNFSIRNEFKESISFEEKKNLQQQFSEFHISQYEVELEEYITIIIVEKNNEFSFYVEFNKMGFMEVSDKNNMLNTIEKELNHIEEIHDNIDWKNRLQEPAKDFWYNHVSFDEYRCYPNSLLENYIKN